MRSCVSKKLIYSQNILFSAKYPVSVYERYFSNKNIKECIFILYIINNNIVCILKREVSVKSSSEDEKCIKSDNYCYLYKTHEKLGKSYFESVYL